MRPYLDDIASPLIYIKLYHTNNWAPDKVGEDKINKLLFGWLSLRNLPKIWYRVKHEKNNRTPNSYA